MIFCKPCVVPLDPPRNRVHLNLDGTCDNMNTVATFQVRQHFVVFVTSFWYLNLLLGDLFLYIPKKINFTFNCFLIEVHIIPSSTIPNVDWLGAEINLVVALNNWKYDIKLLKIIHTAEFFLQGSVYFSEVKCTYTKKLTNVHNDTKSIFMPLNILSNTISCGIRNGIIWIPGYITFKLDEIERKKQKIKNAKGKKIMVRIKIGWKKTSWYNNLITRLTGWSSKRSD